MNMPQTCQHNYNITVILCHPNAPQKHSATCHSNGRLQKPSSVVNKLYPFKRREQKDCVMFMSEAALTGTCLCLSSHWSQGYAWYLCHFPRFAFQWLGCLHYSVYVSSSKSNRICIMGILTPSSMLSNYLVAPETEALNLCSRWHGRRSPEPRVRYKQWGTSREACRPYFYSPIKPGTGLNFP